MIPDHLILISSEIIQAVKVQDNGETLVDLAAHAKSRKSPIKVATGVKVREGVADKLINAQQHLPDGYRLHVVDGYRSPAEQETLYSAHREKLKERHSDWSDDQLDLEASKLYSPPGSTMPHAAGSAVDLTVVDDRDQDLNMGTRFQDDPEKTGNRTYTLSEDIADDQKANRKLLIDAMNAGDFTNYATEWWHWSTGDQYWAFHNRQGFAVYGTIKE